MSRKQLGLFFSAFSMILLMMAVIYGRQVFAQGQGDGRDAAFVAPQAPSAIIPGTPMDLAGAMDIPSGAIVSASDNGSDPLAFGIGDAPLGIYFPTRGNTFAILSTGLAASADTPNDSGSLSYELDGLNNTDGTGQDLVQLALELNIPGNINCVGFDFAFYSEEFPEWVGFSYNDTFTAELGGTNQTITNSQVIAPLNFAFDPYGQIISVNNAFGVYSPTLSTYDGVTPFLRATTPVTPSSVVEIVFSIQDLGDSDWDSAVFIDNFFFSDDQCQTGTGYTPEIQVINPNTGGILQYNNPNGTSTSLEFPPGATDEPAIITFTPLFSPTQPFGGNPVNDSPEGGFIYAGHAFNVEGAAVQQVYLPFISKNSPVGAAATPSSHSQPATLNIQGSQPPTDTTFYLNQPVTITLNYNESDWEDAGISSEESLMMLFYDENDGVWYPANYTCLGVIDPLPQPVHDTVSNTYQIQVCHFTEFGFVGN